MEKVRDQELYRDAQLQKGERREKKTTQYVEKEEIRDKEIHNWRNDTGGENVIRREGREERKRRAIG
jgi:hypothetical protein